MSKKTKTLYDVIMKYPNGIYIKLYSLKDILKIYPKNRGNKGKVKIKS